MSDQPDKIDSWLRADIEPLPPPPGSFERITRRARGRKSSRALAAVAGSVIVIAAAVALPKTAATIFHNGSGGAQPVTAGSAVSAQSHTASPHQQAGAGGHVATQSSAPVPPGTAALSPGGSGAPVPANFQPTSVTFIGTRMGAVIGQAGTPGHCFTRYCTSLAGTSDYGRTWYGVSAPLTGGPSGSTGVSQLRFLNTRDGWAFDPALFVTHDGGAHWSPEHTTGLGVTDLETANGRAFALFGACTQASTGCAGLTLYSSAASSGRWQLVPGPVRALTATGPAAQAMSGSLVLAGASGYLLAPSGQLYAGPLTGAAWHLVAQAPCVPGPPNQIGQPTAGLLAAGSNQLFELCASGTGAGGTGAAGGTQSKTLYVSADGGRTWKVAGQAPAQGVATSLAAAQGNLVVLATSAGIDLSKDGGATWSARQVSPPGAAAGLPGFSYIGLTDQDQGVAIPADPALHEVYITTDSGATWHPSVISSP